MIKVAVDYDDTFTLNPALMSRLTRVLKSAGCEVKIVTWRHSIAEGNNILEMASKHLEIDVIYCGGQPKQAICKYLGWEPDVWVDDKPETIPDRATLGIFYTHAMMREAHLEHSAEINNHDESHANQVGTKDSRPRN